ncbi:MAG: hypothetical protein J6P73_00410 [Bacteroidales bacterium]|nr:hypothetical protein [Bacteroidales bacterium]
MRTFRMLGMAILAMALLASCGSKRNTTTNNYNNGNQPITEGTRVLIPCQSDSYDDADYFRDLGIGTALNPQMARKAAVKAAQSMVKERLNGLVKGLSTDYSNSTSGTASADKVQSIIEGEFTTVIEKMLNDADKVCEDMVKLDDGSYRAYYAIQISKKEIVNKTADVLSENEELEILFKRDQFRKYAEDYMNKQKGN